MRIWLAFGAPGLGNACLDLIVHARHGLNYQNIPAIAHLPHMCDLNIGRSLVARAVLVGLERAIKEMKILIWTDSTNPLL